MALTGSSRSRSDARSDKSAQELRDQLDRLREDISALNEAMADFGVAKASELKKRANGVPAELMETYDSFLEGIGREVSQLERSLDKRVRGKPLQSLGIAAGIGFVVALLLGR